MLSDILDIQIGFEEWLAYLGEDNPRALELDLPDKFSLKPSELTFIINGLELLYHKTRKTNSTTKSKRK